MDMEMSFCLIFPKYNNSYSLNYLLRLLVANNNGPAAKTQLSYMLSSLPSARKCNSHS